MKKLMHAIVLSCLNASKLIEKKMAFKLTFIEKLQLKMHLAVCKSCTLYEKQSTKLDILLQEYIQDNYVLHSSLKDNSLVRLKDKIIKSLRK